MQATFAPYSSSIHVYNTCINVVQPPGCHATADDVPTSRCTAALPARALKNFRPFCAVKFFVRGCVRVLRAFLWARGRTGRRPIWLSFSREVLLLSLPPSTLATVLPSLAPSLMSCLVWMGYLRVAPVAPCCCVIVFVCFLLFPFQLTLAQSTHRKNV